MKNSLFLSIIICLCFFACKRPTAYLNENSTWEELRSPALSNVSVYDTLPKKSLSYASIKQLNGVKASYISGKSTTYFEYEGEPSSLLFAISTLPFKKTDISDTLCRKVDNTFSLSGKTILSEEEIRAASFFWEINPDEYTFYECIKGSQRHTILINNLTRKILHRIEV